MIANDINQILQRGEVRLSEIFTIISSRSKWIFGFMALSILLGVMNEISKPTTYRSTLVILPEAGPRTQLPSISTIIGGEGGNTVDAGAMGPGMFPKIVESSPFLLELIDEKFYFKSFGAEISLYDFFISYDASTLFGRIFGTLVNIPNRISGVFKSSDPVENGGTQAAVAKDTLFRLTGAEMSVMQAVERRIKIESEEGLVSINVSMPEAEVSTALTMVILDKLLEYVTEYRTKKARQDLEFVKEQYDQAKAEFFEAQVQLAEFRDRNQGIRTQQAKTQEERLQSNYTILFNLYNSLAQQLENKKISLQEDTPSYSIFEPAYVPLQPETTSMFRVILIYGFIGAMLGFIVGMAVLLWPVLISNWKN